MAKIALLGHGIVGSGVAEVVLKNKESISRKASQDIDIKYILDIRDFSNLPYAELFIKDFNIILNDDEIKVVVEVIGGITPAYDFVKASLLKGKSVVTSNKELVAQKGAELLEIASKNNVNFFFEASVGGGIPIIRPINQCLAANELHEIVGILNGTTNFILTKMIKEQMPFDDALKIAQELGYAEKNPEADVEGHDTCRKICILASLAFGVHIYPENVHTEGITNISMDDIKCADEWKGVIKLVGRAKKLDDGKIYIIVAPHLISREHSLANVEDVFNGIVVSGDAIGDVMFYGRGAGKLPTASAVVADVIDCLKHSDKRANLYWKDTGENEVADYREQTLRKMVCLSCDDKFYTEKKVLEVFDNIEEINHHIANEFAFITPPMKEKDLDAKIESLERIDIDTGILSVIRVL